MQNKSIPSAQFWLRNATESMTQQGIPSPRLDAEIILADTLKKSRTYLHAHPEQLLEPHSEEIANSRLNLRLSRTPIAYIVGYKEFFGRRFNVTPDTLIPRPESEDIIVAVKSLTENSQKLRTAQCKVIDVGTGSGCLGITLKLEFPNFDVTLSDISRSALNIAKENAELLTAKVRILKSNLLDDYTDMADIIVANLPYVDETWQRSPETNYEPASALFAGNGGLELMINLISQTKSKLKLDGYLILEADPEQHAALKIEAKKSGLNLVSAHNYCLVFQKS